MGSDSLQNIERWKNYEQLLAQYSVIVYRRPGFERVAPAAASLRMLDAPLLDISASFIRNEIKAGRSVRYLLPDTVWQYVAENRYYR
jgi:nicotinate-nucleotide adenylyltransferase